MWIYVVLLFLLTLAAYAYFTSQQSSTTSTPIKEEQEIPDPSGSGEYVNPKPYESYVPPSTTTPEMPSLAERETPSSSTTTGVVVTEDTVPTGSNLAVLGKGWFEIVAKGDTGSEKIDVLIDGLKYPPEGTFQLSKEMTKIRFETPRRVDLSNVVLRDRSASRDANGADTNIRVQSIIVNDNGVNVRSRLYQAGRDPNFISNGLLFWGGEFTFVSEPVDPSAQANSTLPVVSSGMGAIEIVAKGDVGNEEFRVVVDGLMYPPVAGAILEDGSISRGVYVVPTTPTRFFIQTPRRVDLANVTIRTTNDAIDPVTGKDRNVRVQSIVINGDGVDVRPRLFRTGMDETRLASVRQGNLFWGGDYTFL